MPNPISHIPILLFPLKLETRFVKDELWIRAFPDVAFLQSHDPHLTHEEHADAKAFKERTSKEERQVAWGELVSKYGVYRSSWIVQISNEQLDELAPKPNATEKESSFYFKWLPDRLVYYVYKQGDITPSYEEDGSVIDRDGLTVLGDGDEWLQDFDEAIKVGMGIKIRIDPADTKFEKIIVSGFRYTDDPLVPAKGLSDLFNNHRYTEGFSFLKYGTATNNTETEKSGHSARDEFQVGDSFTYAVEGLELEKESDPVAPDVRSITAGKYLSKCLGFEIDHLKHVQRADLRPPMLNELYQRASWFALGAQPLFMLFGNQISSETHELIWSHYSKYVKSKGLYSPLKIGSQPYGILPVMNISNVLLPENQDIRESDAFFDKMTVVFAQLMKRWVEMAKGDQSKVPRLKGGDTHEEILKVLSMQEFSSRYQIRALEYRSFKKELYDRLKQRPANTPIFQYLNGLGDSFERVKENVTSLTELLAVDNQSLSAGFDQLLRAPILSFTEADANLVSFSDGNATMTDHQGDVIADGDDQDNTFSFTQEDLGNFQEFIATIRAQNDGELIQYGGELSLFTDLFLKSYINVCQLYYREIVFDLAITDTTSNSKFVIRKVLQESGSSVRKGDPVIEIQDGSSKTIVVEAPFEGKIEKVLVPESSEIRPSMPLFVLKNEAKYQEIRESFITLGQQIIDASNAIVDVQDRKEAQERAIGEAIDLNSYRLDAWITSLAARRIEEMRSRGDFEKGIYFGAYGWVEDLEKDGSLVDEELMDLSLEEGGIIHTPGVAQTIASSVFKNSYLSHRQGNNSNPFASNLTSDRLQKSQFLLEGIRQGQQLEALLGYQLERHLHENGLHTEIYALREAFPLSENTSVVDGRATGFVNLSVVDGLRAIKRKNDLPVSLASNKEQVQRQIEKLEDTLDGTLDALFYEAGYQVTQGNLTQAAAAIDATKGEIEPPALEAIKTRISGTGISHKLIMIFRATAEKHTLDNARAFAEPNLENWLKENIGPMNKIGCSVELYNAEDDGLIEEVDVTLAELNIGYLDFMYVSEEPVSDGASELELRIKNHVWEQMENLPDGVRYVITKKGPDNTQSLVDALEIVRYAKAVLGKSRYLKSDDVSLEDEAIQHDRDALDKIKDQRILPIVDRLKGITKSDLNQTDTLELLSRLDFEAAKRFLLESGPIETEELRVAIDKKIVSIDDLLSKYNSQLPFDHAFNCLQQLAKALFGETFILLPPATTSDNFSQVHKASQRLIIGDHSDEAIDQVWGQERIRAWIQGVAQVHENTETFEDWLMVSNVWSQTMELSKNHAYKIVQGPTLSQYPWVALSKREIDGVLEKHYQTQPVYTDPGSGESYPLSDGSYYPDNCESIVVYAPEDISYKESVFGLVIEEFSEHIPDEKVNTGLGFNYNSPNNEPPQAILLAVHPKAAMESDFFWSEADLRDILYDTIDLYKIRMVDIEAIEEYGYVLPMTYWFNIPGGG